MNAISTQTKKVKTSGQEFAYRSFGLPGTRPVVLLNHLAANLDNWDPEVLDLLSKSRTVITFDNSGVGLSNGRVPTTIEGMADDAAKFISSFTDTPVDIIGLSMGGMVTQELAIRHPQLLNRIVLVGTGPRGGSGIEKVTTTAFLSIAKGTLTRSDAKEFIFFKRNKVGKTAAKAFLARLAERVIDRDTPVSLPAFFSQLKAISKFASTPAQNLGALTHPVLVINGDQDIMVPTPLSQDLFERIPNAKIEIFPDSGHGSLFQYPQEFAKSVIDFLEE